MAGVADSSPRHLRGGSSASGSPSAAPIQTGGWLQALAHRIMGDFKGDPEDAFDPESADDLIGSEEQAEAPVAQPRWWRQAPQENPLASFVSAAAPIGEHDVVTRAGDYFRVFAVRGIAFEGADPSHIEDHHRALCAFVKHLIPGRSAVYLHRIHRFYRDAFHVDGNGDDSTASPLESDDNLGSEEGSAWKNGFAARFAQRYQERLDTQPLLRTDLYLTILVRPASRASEISRMGARSVRSAGSAASAGSPKTAAHAQPDVLAERDALRERTLKELADLCALAQRSLRGFGLRPLGIRVERHARHCPPRSAPHRASHGAACTQVPAEQAFWEAGEFLSLLINGRERKVRLPDGPAWQSLPDARLSFAGDTLEIRSLPAVKTGTGHWAAPGAGASQAGSSTGHGLRYAKLLSAKRLQRHVEPGTLGALLYEPCEFIETQSFTPSPKRAAQAALILQRDQLLASEDAGRSEIEELDTALDQLAAGELNMGEYAYTLAVFGDTVEEAAQHAARCAAALVETTDIELAPVDLVADAAWFSQQPGNLQWRPRKATISNRAFAALACAHGFAHGQRDRNPWGPAIALLRASSGAPYYFNFHAQVSGNDDGAPQPLLSSAPGQVGGVVGGLVGSQRDGPDSLGQRLPGNTLLVGSTGSGKTTLLASLLALSARLNPRPRIISFSLDRDTEILIRALGGRFYRLRYGKPTGLNPFAWPVTPQSQALWTRLVQRCIHNPELPLLPADEEAIARAVQAVSLLEAPLRSMSTVRQNLPRSGANSLHDRLARWCAGAELGWVFDERPEHDLGSCSIASLNSAIDTGGNGLTSPNPQELAQGFPLGFDYTELLDAPQVRVPVMMVLLQMMEDALTGEPLIYHVSEAWKALSDPVFAPFLKQQQKTIRKKNGLGIFDTQQVDDLLSTENGRVMVEQSPTKILLANADAVRTDYVEGLGLTDAQFDLFREVTRTSGGRGGSGAPSASTKPAADAPRFTTGAASAAHARRFVVKQGSAFVPCELDLSGMDDEIAVLSATPDNLRRLDAALDEARTRFGPGAEHDPGVWLPLYLRQLRHAHQVRRANPAAHRRGPSGHPADA
jgi:type IV secretion system protein VirB4